MRFAWVTLLIVCCDMLIKLAVTQLDLGGSYLFFDQSLHVELLNASHQAFAHYFAARDVRLTAWVLLGGLLLVFLVLFRVARGYLNSARYTGLGVQLAVGGIISQVVDLLVYGAIVPLAELRALEFFTLAGSISDIGIFSGALMMGYGLLQHRLTSRAPLVSLARDRTPRIDLSALPRGIDNIHIDVALSPSFIKSARQLIDYLIGKFLNKNFNEQQLTKLSDTTLDNFRMAYTEMVRAAIFHAKETGHTERIELLHLAVIKFLQQEIQNQTLGALQRVNDRQGRMQQMSALAIGQTSDRVSTLFLSRNALFYKVSQTLFRLLQKTENHSLRKLQNAVHGEEEELVLNALNIPLVQAASPIDEDVLLSRYVLLGHMDSDPFNFPRLDNLLSQTFANCLPALEPKRKKIESEDEDSDEVLSHDDDTTSTFLVQQSEVAGTGEYLRALNQSSVLMVADNIPRLLDEQWTLGEIRRAQDAKDKPLVRTLKRQLRFQVQQLALLRNTLESANLIMTILCAYEVARLYQRHPTARHPSLLMKVMNQDDHWLSTRKRVKTFYRSNRDLPPIEEVFTSIRNVRKQMTGEIDSVLIRFVSDFANYRHDLRLDFMIQQALNEIRILTDEKDILTSRSNQSLHEYLAASELSGSNAGVKSHVIIKADLRGSTTITDELIRRKLNPATHFHRHFFQPINEVIDNFGAEKVFIEGDAVILIITEMDTSHEEHLTMSRACGLASGIMRVVEQQNIQLKHLQLPLVELGIGIAYNPTPPRYLYDGDTRITISPAINRADRLSACAHGLRTWLKDQNVPNYFHGSVYEPSELIAQLGQKAQKDMVYNQNGIILEPVAFDKLTKELKLSRIRHNISTYSDSNFYVSRYPDVRNNYHVLVLREAPVRIYDTAHGYLETDPVEGRKYYEVIYDRQVLKMLQKVQKGETAQPSGATAPAINTRLSK